MIFIRSSSCMLSVINPRAFMSGSQDDHHDAACARRLALGGKPDISNEPEPDITKKL
jgi:hypothetical protein